MSRTQTSAVAGPRPGVAAPAPSSSGFRSDRAADRWMRRVLRITGVDLRSGEGAHHAFRISVVISALRCLITYVAIPVLVPILSLAGWLAAPVGIVLCAIAAVNGMISVRRFWRADHPHRWTYTAFIGVVFVILTISLTTELSQLGVLPRAPRTTREPIPPPTDAAGDDTVRSAPPTTDGWTPEDRAPSAAENNFMSFALFGFLVLFGIGCFILF